MSPLGWVGIVAAIVIAILLLLYRLEASRRKTAELERDNAKARVITLVKILELERQLFSLAGTARNDMEAKIKKLEERAKALKEGETNTDIFGILNGEDS